MTGHRNVTGIVLVIAMVLFVTGIATAIDLNSSTALQYYGNIEDGTGLDFAVATNGATTVYGDLDLQNTNDITNFFQTTTCQNGFVTKIYSNGSYACESASFTDTDDQNLSEVLAQGNVADQPIAFSDGIKIGTSASTFDFSSSTVGAYSSAGQFASTAGYYASAGANSAAFGAYAEANAQNAVALGEIAKATAEGAVAIGNQANAPNPYEATFGNLNGEELDINVTGNLTVHGNGGLDMNSNEVQDVSQVKGTNGRISFGNGVSTFVDAGKNTGYNLKGPSDNFFFIYDVNQSRNVFEARQSGTVHIPSGNLDMEGHDVVLNGGYLSSVNGIRTGGAIEIGDYETSTSGNKNDQIAIGNDALATAQSATGIGRAANASGRWSVALGNAAKADSDGSVALGDSTESFGGQGSVAIGRYASTSAEAASAVGTGADATAEGAVAIGNQANAPNPYEATFGNLGNQRLDVNVTGNLTVHGDGGLDIEEGGIDIFGGGLDMNSYELSNVENIVAADYRDYLDVNIYDGQYFGVYSRSDGKSLVKFHENGSVDLLEGNLDMNRNDITGVNQLRFQNSVQIGNSLTSTANPGEIAIGAGSATSGYDSIAIGYSASATNYEGTALGFKAGTDSAESIAVGPWSRTEGYRTTALGKNATAAGTRSVAIGFNANAPNPDEATFGNLGNERLDVNVTGDLTVHGNGGLDMNGNDIVNCGTINGVDCDNLGGGGASNLSAVLENGDSAGGNNITDIGTLSGSKKNLVYGFEKGTIYPFLTKGDRSWNATNSTADQGNYSAATVVSGTEAANLTIEGYASDVRFAIKFNSSTIFDELRFLVDGVNKKTVSGAEVTGWETVAVSVPPGKHTIKWWVESDDFGDAGAVKAAIDDIRFTGERLRAERMEVSGLTGEINQASFYGFEDGTLEPFSTQDTGKNWTTTNSTSSDGNYSARSDNSSVEGDARLTITKVTHGTVRFDYKVSSEPSYDNLTFYVDGESKANWSGEIDWTTAEFSVPPGEHTFKWTYDKDEYISEGDDAVWVDNIRFPDSSVLDIESSVKVGRPGQPSDLFVHGNLTATGVKNWLHKLNKTHEAVYTAQESPEIRAVIEGTAKVVNGTAVVKLPSHFWKTVSDTRPSIKVQVTPTGTNMMPVGVRNKSQLDSARL